MTAASTRFAPARWRAAEAVLAAEAFAVFARRCSGVERLHRFRAAARWRALTWGSIVVVIDYGSYDEHQFESIGTWCRVALAPGAGPGATRPPG